MPAPRPRRRRDTGADALGALIDRIDAARDAGASADTLATGFASVDRMLGGGLRPQDLVVLAGDVGSGKSALALAVALRAAQAGVPTLLLSGEMSPDRLLERAVALEARASIDDLRQGRLDDATRSAVGAAAIRLRGLPLAFRPLFGHGFDEVRGALEMLPPPRLVIVDSLQQVAPPRPVARADDRIAHATRALKALALDRGLALLATAHVPRIAATRADPRPALDDLPGRGAVPQHADVVLGLYREEMYRPGYGVEGATELLVRKNRNGPTGFVDLYFYARWLRFEDLLDPEP